MPQFCHLLRLILFGRLVLGILCWRIRRKGVGEEDKRDYIEKLRVEGISGGEETLEESGMGAAVVFESSRWDFSKVQNYVSAS